MPRGDNEWQEDPTNVPNASPRKQPGRDTENDWTARSGCENAGTADAGSQLKLWSARAYWIQSKARFRLRILTRRPMTLDRVLENRNMLMNGSRFIWTDLHRARYLRQCVRESEARLALLLLQPLANAQSILEEELRLACQRKELAKVESLLSDLQAS